jgi:hypothetical protein
VVDRGLLLLANPVALLAVLLLWVIEGSLASLAVDENPAVGGVVPLNNPWRRDLRSALAWALVAVRRLRWLAVAALLALAWALVVVSWGWRGELLLAVAALLALAWGLRGVLLLASSVHLSAREVGTEGGGGGARSGEEQCGMKLVACCGGKM